MAFAIRDQPMAGLNLTPLIDVLLVLLVIFMVATALPDRALSIALPGSDPVSVQPATELRLQIGIAGDYVLDGQPLSRAGLDAALRDAHARSTDLQLRIAAADDSDYQVFVEALGVARHAGIHTIRSEMR